MKELPGFEVDSADDLIRKADAINAIHEVMKETLPDWDREFHLELNKMLCSRIASIGTNTERKE